MFAQIPGSNSKADIPPPAHPIARSAAVARLEALTLRPSSLLWRAQLLIHLLLAFCLLLAFLPLFYNEPRWIGLWLISQVLLLASIRHCYALRQLPVRNLAFAERGWSLVDDCGEHRLELVDKAVVWSWLVVLRYREQGGLKRFNLVLLPDSANAQELRRLRVWLRTQI